MRLAALCAGTVMAGLAVVSAQAACLKGNAPDQVAKGRLTAVRISIPDYKLKEQAYILRLASDACLERSGEFDKVEGTKHPRVYDGRCRTQAAAVARGRPVRVIGAPFGERTITRRSCCV
jgi:hypothetical protein